MKKFSIFFACFAFLWWIAIIYIDIKFDPHTAYWLAFQLFGRLLLVASIFFNTIRRRENGKWAIFFSVCFWTLFMAYFGNKDVVKYKNDVCLDKFGREFNEVRKSRGIPIIPAGWHESHRSNGSTDWEGKEHIIGHTDKYIIVDPGCVLKFEDDDYKLKPGHGIKQSLSIRTTFARGEGRDTFSFTYSIGDSSRTITRLQADSIFEAQKIGKDY